MADKLRRGFGDMQESQFPKFTTTERNALTTNAAAIAANRVTAGVTIYNSTTNKLNFWNGAAWEVVTSA